MMRSLTTSMIYELMDISYPTSFVITTNVALARFRSLHNTVCFDAPHP